MSCGFRAPIARALAAAAALILAGPWAAPAKADRLVDAPRTAAEAADVPLPAPRPPELAARAIANDPDARLCALIADSADRHGLPRAFFARLLWKESLFLPDAVSPVGAQGIAQFMPGTAAERGLEDPFDPGQAVPASAHFLADLRAQFGNLGLAAAAYNGGPHRVERWLDRRGGLPWETVNYVRSITFRPVEWFREPGREVEPRPLEKGKSFDSSCRALPKTRGRGVLASVRRMPWGVQVASGVNRSAALRAGKKVRSRFGGILSGKPVTVHRSKRRTGARYAARIGAPSRREAGLICNRLKRAGGACVVFRN